MRDYSRSPSSREGARLTRELIASLLTSPEKGIASPAAGDDVAIRTPGELVRRHSCRGTGEGANAQQNALPQRDCSPSLEGRG